MSLEVSLFGRFEVRRDGIALAPSSFRKRAADLVKLLALAPKHAMHRDQLVEQLWPGAAPADGSNNLYRAVHDLRSVTGQRAVVFRQGVVTLADVAVDVDRFERDVRSADAAVAAEALGLYVGDLLPEDYDLELVAARRVALRLLFLDQSLRIAAVGGQRAIDVLRRASSIDPLHEEVAVRLASLLAGAGRLSEAKQVLALSAARIEEAGLGPSERIEQAQRTLGQRHPGATLRSPRTRYAKSGDVNIAYQVVGDNGPDLVFVMGWVSHVEYFWTHPRVARFFERLASFSRLILFDKRGTGLSDRVTAMPHLQQRMDDVRAVMVAAGSEEAVIMGVSEGGPMSALFAATYPERTLGLVIYGGYARRLWAPDYPWAPRPESRARFFREIEEQWGGVVDLATIAPSEVNDPAFCDWWSSYLRMSASPGAAVALARMNSEIDIRDSLSAIRAPTLILHREGDRDMSVEEGRYLARHIAGSCFVALPGIDHLPFAGDPEPLLSEIETFVRGFAK